MVATDQKHPAQQAVQGDYRIPNSVKATPPSGEDAPEGLPGRRCFAYVAGLSH